MCVKGSATSQRWGGGKGSPKIFDWAEKNAGTVFRLSTNAAHFQQFSAASASSAVFSSFRQAQECCFRQKTWNLLRYQTTVPLLGKIAMALAWTFVLLASLHYICADCLCKIARRLIFIQYHQVQSITINDHQFWATSECEFSSTSDEHQKNKWLFAKF